MNSHDPGGSRVFLLPYTYINSSAVGANEYEKVTKDVSGYNNESDDSKGNDCRPEDSGSKDKIPVRKRTSLIKTLSYINGQLVESGDESEEEHIVVQSTGTPDRFRFLTEIFVPKMRGFEELSDRCILDSVSVGLTLNQVVKSSMDHFMELLKTTELTDTQLEVTKYVRRRARNRVAARRSRLKKHTDMLDIMEEIHLIRKKKEKLIQSYLEMDLERKKLSEKVEKLHKYLLQEACARGEKEILNLARTLDEAVLEADKKFRKKIQEEVSEEAPAKGIGKAD